MRFQFQFYALVAIAVSTVGAAPIAYGQSKAATIASDSKVAAITSEKELIAILSGDAPKADKALACKRLAVYGSAAAVGELAKLLSDEQLASWSRIALEAIPGKESEDALRAAAGTLNGRLLVGVLNSIGVRRDASATEVLTQKLSDSNAEVASAAAVALGRIGGPAATEKLVAALSTSPEGVRSAVAEGCVLCAEQYLNAGDKKAALTTYQAVRSAKVPKQRIVEATRGAILSSPDGIALLTEQLRSEDKALFQIGLGTAREMTDKQVGAALLGEIEKAAPDRAALMVQALAELKSNVDIATILRVASAGPKAVRVAAIGALGQVGDSSCVAPLLKIATEPSADLTQTVKSAIVNIQDESVNKEIMTRLPNEKGEMQKLLIELVGLRRIEATAELTKALANSDSAIRTAALESLGSTISQDQIGLLIDQVISPKNAEDATIARQSLKTAAVRMPDREACAASLAAALQKSQGPAKVTILEIIGDVGGTKALEAIGAAAKSSDAQLKDVSTRLLGGWMTTDAAPVLLELAKTGPADKFQGRAMKGYIRIIKQFIKTEPERLDMCAKAMETAKQPEELKLIVDILKLNPSIGTLKMAVQATKNPAVKEDAVQAVKAIAAKLGDNADAKKIVADAGL